MKVTGKVKMCLTILDGFRMIIIIPSNEQQGALPLAHHAQPVEQHPKLAFPLEPDY